MLEFDAKNMPEATIEGDVTVGKISVFSGGEIIFDGGLTVDHKIIHQEKDLMSVVVPHGASLRFTGHVTCGEYIGGSSNTTPVKAK